MNPVASVKTHDRGLIALGSVRKGLSPALLQPVTASQSAYHNGLANHSRAGAQRASQNAIAARSFGNIASASFQEMPRRFKATMDTENDRFILTNLSDGVGLVKVNKDTGKTGKEIVLKEKKPVYEEDDMTRYLYYPAGTGEISAFSLNN